MNGVGMLAGAGLLVVVLSLVVAVLVYALILMLAHKWVAGSNPGYGKALVTTLAVFGANIVIGLVLGFVLGWLGLIGSLIMWVINFLVAAWLIQQLMKPAGGSKISFGRACGVEAVVLAISIAIGIVLGIIGAVVGVSLFKML